MHTRRLKIEHLESRQLLAAASFVESSVALGLGGLRGSDSEFHAGGLTFTDLNRDGYADLYLIGPSTRGNRLYINVDDGSGGRTFVRAAGDGGTSYTAGDSSGSVAADYDNDGDLDIYLTNFGNGPHDLDGADNILFKNMWMEDHPTGVGDPLSLRFIDVTASTDPTPADPAGDIQHGLARAEFHNPDPLFDTHILNHTIAAAWADVNRDGWVDIYVGSWDGTNGNPAESHDGKLGERDTLYLNNGDGTFTDVTMSPDGTIPPQPPVLIDDGSFELAAHNSQTSNSAWTLSGPNDTTLFWGTAGETFAASNGERGIWFRGFAGDPLNPIDASATQTVVAPEDGDYTLSFDAKVQASFASAASGFQVTITSDGTGGSATTGNLLNLAPDFDFNTYSLTLSGVSAGDNLTIVAEMLGANGSTPPPLLEDGGFENATHDSQSSSDWTVNAPNNTALFWDAPWAASTGEQGVWFRGFAGNPGGVDASVSQVVVAAENGDYTLEFEAKVEANFASVAGALQVTVTSDGTGGSATTGNLITLAPDLDFNTYSLTLSGVTAGDNLTIGAEMLDATGGSGPALSAMVDAFRFTGGAGMVDRFRFVDPDAEDGWQQVGGWQYEDGTYNNPSIPAEFSGHNALQFADFNNDGWQDLIVATMGGAGVAPTRDMLYINRGVDAGGDWLGYDMVSYDIGFGGSEPSDMGVTVADIDNDGDLDYFSTLLPDAHPIWINNLVDSGSLGFTRTTINNTFSWGANFHDFDNNGRVDLLVGTEIGERSYLHLQEDNGVMTERGVASGFTALHSTRGVAVADYDRDGFSDTAMWHWSGAVNPGILFYENRSASLNANLHFLTLELEGDPTLPGQFKSTRDAIGARAYVTADFDGNDTVDADETRMEEVLSGHSQASTTSSLALEFGIGQATTADVRIVWGSGRETILHDVAADQFLSVVEQARATGGFDFLLWQRGFGTTTDADDLVVWEANFGGGSSAVSTVAVSSSLAVSHSAELVNLAIAVDADVDASAAHRPAQQRAGASNRVDGSATEARDAVFAQWALPPSLKHWATLASSPRTPSSTNPRSSAAGELLGLVYGSENQSNDIWAHDLRSASGFSAPVSRARR